MANVNKTVDVAALDLLCDKLECGDANHRATAEQIRNAVKSVKPQLPEGFEWPRFTDGELVKFGDEVECIEGKIGTITFYPHGFVLNGHYYNKGESVFRPEPEVLDADGVPIKVGDTVWTTYLGTKIKVAKIHRDNVYSIESEDADEFSGWYKANELTHRKPDTKESVRAEIIEAVKADYAVNLLPLFERYEQVVLRKAGE